MDGKPALRATVAQYNAFMSTDILVPTSTSLVADADVLIKLAQHPANLAAIGAISKAVDRGTYTLIVPEPVLNAFNREKVRAAESFWNTQRGTIRNLRLLRDVFSQHRQPSAFRSRIERRIRFLQSRCMLQGPWLSEAPVQSSPEDLKETSTRRKRWKEIYSLPTSFLLSDGHRHADKMGDASLTGGVDHKVIGPWRCSVVLDASAPGEGRRKSEESHEEKNQAD